MNPLSQLPYKQPPTCQGGILLNHHLLAMFQQGSTIPQRQWDAPATIEFPHEMPGRVGVKTRSSDCPWPGPPAGLSAGVNKTEQGTLSVATKKRVE